MSEPQLRPSANLRKRIERAVVAVPRFIIGCLILVSVAINLANVIGRYFFQSSIVWAEEAMIYIMVWCVFIGAILVTWEGRHLKMDLLSTTLPGRWKRATNLLAAVLFVVIAALVAIVSFRVTSMMGQLGQQSVVAKVPMVIPHAAVTLGFVLMLVVVLVRFRFHINGNHKTEVDDALGERAGKSDADM
jgi:TRAP-type C4-dicarboxylate transport system permease small subunit